MTLLPLHQVHVGFCFTSATLKYLAPYLNSVIQCCTRLRNRLVVDFQLKTCHGIVEKHVGGRTCRNSSLRGCERRACSEAVMWNFGCWTMKHHDSVQPRKIRCHTFFSKQPPLPAQALHCHSTICNKLQAQSIVCKCHVCKSF